MANRTIDDLANSLLKQKEHNERLLKSALKYMQSHVNVKQWRTLLVHLSMKTHLLLYMERKKMIEMHKQFMGVVRWVVKEKALLERKKNEMLSNHEEIDFTLQSECDLWLEKSQRILDFVAQDRQQRLEGQTRNASGIDFEGQTFRDVTEVLYRHIGDASELFKTEITMGQMREDKWREMCSGVFTQLRSEDEIRNQGNRLETLEVLMQQKQVELENMTALYHRAKAAVCPCSKMRHCDCPCVTECNCKDLPGDKIKEWRKQQSVKNEVKRVKLEDKQSDVVNTLRNELHVMKQTNKELTAKLERATEDAAIARYSKGENSGPAGFTLKQREILAGVHQEYRQTMQREQKWMYRGHGPETNNPYSHQKAYLSTEAKTLALIKQQGKQRHREDRQLQQLESLKSASGSGGDDDMMLIVGPGSAQPTQRLRGPRGVGDKVDLLTYVVPADSLLNEGTNGPAETSTPGTSGSRFSEFSGSGSSGQASSLGFGSTGGHGYGIGHGSGGVGGGGEGGFGYGHVSHSLTRAIGAKLLPALDHSGGFGGNDGEDESPRHPQWLASKDHPYSPRGVVSTHSNSTNSKVSATSSHSASSSSSAPLKGKGGAAANAGPGKVIPSIVANLSPPPATPPTPEMLAAGAARRASSSSNNNDSNNANKKGRGTSLGGSGVSLARQNAERRSQANAKAVQRYEDEDAAAGGFTNSPSASGRRKVGSSSSSSSSSLLLANKSVPAKMIGPRLVRCSRICATGLKDKGDYHVVLKCGGETAKTTSQEDTQEPHWGDEVLTFMWDGHTGIDVALFNASDDCIASGPGELKAFKHTQTVTVDIKSLVTKESYGCVELDVTVVVDAVTSPRHGGTSAQLQGQLTDKLRKQGDMSLSSALAMKTKGQVSGKATGAGQLHGGTVGGNKPINGGGRIIFVLGGPGSGKGTQCLQLANQYGFAHLSAGDLLDDERKKGGKVAELIEKHKKEGTLVPGETIVDVLSNGIAEKMRKGKVDILVDGFPRSLENLKMWDERVGSKYNVVFALFFECSTEVMKQRLLKRGETSGRIDDNADTIVKRFRTYKEASLPVLKELDKRGWVRRINADDTSSNVFRMVTKLVAPLFAPRPEVIFVMGAAKGGKTAHARALAKMHGKYFVSINVKALLSSSNFVVFYDGKEDREVYKDEGLVQAIQQSRRSRSAVPSNVLVNSLSIMIQMAARDGKTRVYLDGFPRTSQDVDAWINTMEQTTETKYALSYSCNPLLCEKRALEKKKKNKKLIQTILGGKDSKLSGAALEDDVVDEIEDDDEDEDSTNKLWTFTRQYLLRGGMYPVVDLSTDNGLYATHLLTKKMLADLGDPIFTKHAPVQTTVALIRPRALKRGLKHAIVNIIKLANFDIVDEREFIMTAEQARHFDNAEDDRGVHSRYRNDDGTNQAMIKHMTEGPCLALALRRKNAVLAWRKLMGPSSPSLAQKLSPHSIRAIFGVRGGVFDADEDESNDTLFVQDDDVDAVVYGCDSVYTANKQMQMLFGTSMGMGMGMGMGNGATSGGDGSSVGAGAGGEDKENKENGSDGGDAGVGGKKRRSVAFQNDSLLNSPENSGPPHSLILAGGPGSGKGSQSEMLVEKFGLVPISTGELLRQEIEQGTRLGKQCKAFMDQGKLVPDELVVNLVKNRIAEKDCQTHGWILDGFPRTKVQAESMYRVCPDLFKPEVFLLLDVDDEELVSRICGRGVDPNTGIIYHDKFKPPPPGVVLQRRKDDTREVAANRIQVFKDNVDSVKGVFARQFVSIDGNKTPQEVSREILKYFV